MSQPQTVNVPEVTQNYALQEVKFNFRTDKTLGTKRPTVALQLPFLTIQGLISILESGDEKQTSLILETLQEPILAQAREQVDANESISQDTLDTGKLTWEYIANMPAATRRGGGIPKETWEAFAENYLEVMPGITGKAPEKVKNAAELLAGKFAKVKTRKDVLKVLLGQLDIWFAQSPKAEEFMACYEFLSNKGKELLEADDTALLANLL